MKLRKLLLGLTLVGLFSNQVLALTPEEEVARAKAAANTAWWANYNAILAEQARQMEIVYGIAPTVTIPAPVPTPVVVPVVVEPVVAPVVTAPVVVEPVVVPVVTAPVVVETISTAIVPEIDISKFDTAEYTADSISAGKFNDDFLRVINASSAWARGYTGAGSLILIIDSGINATHKEFTDSIAYTKDFTGKGMIDLVGHGTKMAGIAAANWDGVGMAGVAPDAMLAIAKVTNTASYNFSSARNAIIWGDSLNADVANISANILYDATSKRTFYKLTDGSWANSSATYKTNFYTGSRATGFYLNESPKMWEAALGTSEMVIVNSAGNSGLNFPENPASMAYATRPDGTLYLNGQMLVVGAYDIDSNSIAAFSNKAGHLCQGFNIVGGTCNDTYRMSDFFILAQGNVYSTGKAGDTYVIGTGTSEAAASVSGAVAIIRQQWPQMTGANIVKLLTATANKDLMNYDKNVMGAGLLDLEKATKPYGVVGIPTVGRTGITSMGGGFTTSTSGGLGSISSKLSSVMVIDEFDRDYYVNMAQTANNKRARADYSPIAKATFYEDYNPYNKLNYYTFNGKATAGDYDLKMAMNEHQQVASIEMGKSTKLNNKTKMRVGFGTMNEQNAWVGNSIGGALGQVNTSNTQFMNLSGVYNIDRNFSLFGGAWLGYTTADMQTTGLITKVGATESYSWNIGLDYTKEKHSVGTTLSQPVTVSKGAVNVAIPTGYTANGLIAYDRSNVNIRPTINEYDVGLYYKYKTDSMSLITYGEHQINYLNQSGITNNQIGFSLVKEF